MALGRTFSGWSILLLSLLNVLTACGASTPGDSQLAADPQDDKVAVLRFASEYRDYKTFELELKLRLSLSIAGAEVYASQEMKMASSGQLTLRKLSLGKGSALFADSHGTLMVEPGDEYEGECSYDASFGIEHSVGAEFFTLSLKGEGEKGWESDLGVLAHGFDFAVQPGMTLPQLESFCEEHFDKEVRPRVEQDLRRAAESSIRILGTKDPRVAALQHAMEGESSEFYWLGKHWQLSEPSISRDGEFTTIHADFTSSGLWRKDQYSFDYRFDKQGKLITSSVIPLGTSKEYSEIQKFSVFLARNLHAWVNRDESGSREFMIDTILLR